VRISAFLFVLASSILLFACSEQQRIPEAFVGVWQSDEALTLASLEESQSVSPEDREVFTDDFFGDRVFIYNAYEYTAYWVGDEWEDVEQEENWLPYDIVDSGPDFVTLRYAATPYTEPEEKTWRVDGDLIYVEEDRWDFKEYYGRIRE
jgi:hypothetical protein